ncbi:hypothetical protein F2P81_011160 [Scophthalmus maximus]|uniref:Uncharacterized protein n=1 Tax=Scophthalmus maximus TaxID=52904 RepID=A0A6A4SUP9_SCOMX|nr:hypothetical protein F2P81_011160 [Scophthalmus maximus]
MQQPSYRSRLSHTGLPFWYASSLHVRAVVTASTCGYQSEDRGPLDDKQRPLKKKNNPCAYDPGGPERQTERTLFFNFGSDDVDDPRLYVTTENNALKKGGFDASEPGNPRSGLVEERLSSSRHSAAETLSLVELQEPCPEAAAAAAQLSLANSQIYSRHRSVNDAQTVDKRYVVCVPPRTLSTHCSCWEKKGNNPPRTCCSKAPNNFLLFSPKTEFSASAKDDIKIRFSGERLRHTDNDSLKTVFHSYSFSQGENEKVLVWHIFLCHTTTLGSTLVEEPEENLNLCPKRWRTDLDVSSLQTSCRS